MAGFEDIAKIWAGVKAINKNNKATKQDATRNMAFAQSLDWEPEYASAHAPTYQKTQSPVADSYLESFLLGNNPDATFSGSPNAGAVKAQQQARTNNMYGTPQARHDMQQQLLSQTPWKVEAPTRAVEPDKEKTFKAVNPEYGNLGLTQQMVDDITAKTGLNMSELVDGSRQGPFEGNNMQTGINGKDWERVTRSIVGAYNAGDYDAVKELATRDHRSGMPIGRKARARRKEVRREKKLAHKYDAEYKG